MRFPQNLKRQHKDLDENKSVILSYPTYLARVIRNPFNFMEH